MTPSVNAGVGQAAQRLPAYLPAIYREDPFLGQYLWAFEQVLLGLEEEVGDLAKVFDPMEAREEFLPWLSSWVAFTLRSDLETSQQRAFLARIIPLYRRRGTKKNLQDLLSIFTTGVPSIVEPDDTGPAHHFGITLRLQDAAPDILQRQIAIAHALIDLEKPAHTTYELDLSFPTMQIGVTSHIGVDTLLGTIDTDPANASASPALATPATLAAKSKRPKKAAAHKRVAHEGPTREHGTRKSRRRKRDTD